MDLVPELATSVESKVYLVPTMDEAVQYVLSIPLWTSTGVPPKEAFWPKSMPLVSLEKKPAAFSNTLNGRVATTKPLYSVSPRLSTVAAIPVPLSPL